MTQIQASVNVEDKVDSKIEQKIKAIGVASVTTASQLSALKNAVSSLSSRNINGFSNAIASLGRTNFSSLASQMRQLAQVSSQLNGSFSQTALQATKLQIAQTKLQQEQIKSSILNVRLQQQQVALNNAQNKGAISANNLANAQARANTAKIRSQIAATQASTATVRLEREQARLEQQLQRNANTYSQANIGLRQLVGTMLALYSVGKTAISITQLGDQYQSMINKLTLVTNSAGEARNRLASLTDVAKNSYSDLQSITQLYTRLDLALKQVGGTSSEAIQITQTLSKTVALAGLTTSESSSALLQISQAFNKGKLDGDEFRTVMETMPPLADAIADELTRTSNGVRILRGDLLALAPTGVITAEVMRNAFIRASEVIDQKFAELTPTVAFHLQNLQTEAQVYFGAMFKDLGLAETFGNAIKYIANNLELATKVAVAFGIAATAALGFKGVSSLILTVRNVTRAFKTATTAVNAFAIATRATPIGLLIAGISALTLGVNYLFETSLGKSIFPNYDQDKAKAEDYISRLKDINKQMNLMSYTKLAQENTLLNQAMEKNKTIISDTEKRLAKVNEKIAEQQKKYDAAIATLERYRTKQYTNTDIAIIGSGADLAAIAMQEQAEAQKRLIDLKAEETNRQRELDKANQDSIELMKSTLYNVQQQIEKIENARKTIEGKTKSDIEANEQLKAQQKIVIETAEKYKKLKKEADGLREALEKVLGVGADLLPTIDNAGEQKTNEIKKEAQARLEKETQRLLDYAKASKEKQREMDAELRLSKDLASFRDKDGKLTEEGKSLLTARVQALKAVEDRRKADAEAERNARKRSDATQRAIQKQEQYVGKLNDELTLLKEGYQNYVKYNSLYALRLELQQKGITLTDQETATIKSKIDLVEREKALAKEINNIEQNSLAEERQQLKLKLEALSKANISERDRKIGVDDTLSLTGATYGVDQGIEKLRGQYDNFYDHIKDLRRKNYLDEEQAQIALQTLDSNYQDAIYNKRLENLHAMGGMYEVVATAFETFTQSATSNLTSVLNGTKSISDAMRDLGATILNSVVQSIIEMGVKWVASQVMQLAFGKAIMAQQLAASTTLATATASAWATPAALVSLATQGANAPPATQGITSTLLLAKTLAVAGARRNGGTVNAGDLYQVGEGNAPEIYKSRSGRQYMIAGDNGRVFSNKQVMSNGGGNVINVTQNVTINGDGNLNADTLSKFREQTRNVIYEVLANEQRDAGGMLA